MKILEQIITLFSLNLTGVPIDACLLIMIRIVVLSKKAEVTLTEVIFCSETVCGCWWDQAFLNRHLKKKLLNSHVCFYKLQYVNNGIDAVLAISSIKKAQVMYSTIFWVEDYSLYFLQLYIYHTWTITFNCFNCQKKPTLKNKKQNQRKKRRILDCFDNKHLKVS